MTLALTLGRDVRAAVPTLDRVSHDVLGTVRTGLSSSRRLLGNRRVPSINGLIEGRSVLVFLDHTPLNSGSNLSPMNVAKRSEKCMGDQLKESRGEDCTHGVLDRFA